MTDKDPNDLDIEQVLEGKGYHLSQVIGDEHGLNCELWSGHEGSEKWAILFSTASDHTVLYCNSWDELIAQLSKISVICIAASMVPDGDDDGASSPAFLTRSVGKHRPPPLRLGKAAIREAEDRNKASEF